VAAPDQLKPGRRSGPDPAITMASAGTLHHRALAGRSSRSEAVRVSPRTLRLRLNPGDASLRTTFQVVSDSGGGDLRWPTSLIPQTVKLSGISASTLETCGATASTSRTVLAEYK
jgi:hypothetical protein